MPRSLSATPSRRKISMDRAPIWPHFTFGGSLGGRRSATTTSMPRQAKSIASVSPTGPPPTTSTVVFIPPVPPLVFVTILVFERPDRKVARAISGWEELTLRVVPRRLVTRSLLNAERTLGGAAAGDARSRMTDLGAVQVCWQPTYARQKLPGNLTHR